MITDTAPDEVQTDDAQPETGTGIESNEQPTAQDAPHIGTLRIHGEPPIQWDTSDPASVQAATDRFNAALHGSNMLATKVVAGGSSTRTPEEQIREFDATAPEIILTPQGVGG